MPLAKDIAIELRKLADALDKEPEASLTQPTIYFSSWSDKQAFLNVARLLPRPLFKRVETGQFPDLVLENAHKSSALHISARVRQSVMCEIVEPAKAAVYKCVPILSLEEEEALA